MSPDPHPIRVALIGSGMAGASCALGLRHAGAQVTVFERSSRVGGRMASRHATWIDDAGQSASAMFDHGTPSFAAIQPRFRGLMARASAAGHVARWDPIVHTSGASTVGPRFVPMPTMSALAVHLLAGATVQCDRNVRRLQRTVDGMWFIASDHAALAGSFHHVVLAVPPAQAAVLLAGHQDIWAASLAARPMDSCWTLMAATDDVDWPWDAAEPTSGPLAWVARNDRVPGRSAPPDLATWTAHSTPGWSAGRLNAEPETVCAELREALRAQLPMCGRSGQPWRWHHATAHRWSHAGPALESEGVVDPASVWWDATLGLGVCGDWLCSGGVEAAWQSGDELAGAMADSFETTSIASTAFTALAARSPSVSSADNDLVAG